MNISSQPISDTSSSFKTSRIILSGNDVMKIRPTLPGVLVGLALFFSLNGLFLYIIFSGARIVFESQNNLLGLIFIFVGLFLIFLFGKAKLLSHDLIELDKSNNSYCRYKFRLRKHAIESSKLSKFSAVQILKKIVKTHNGTRSIEFTSYEVNLCGNDSQRTNLIDHGAEDQIVSDANTIALYLNLPVVRSNA
ncbi:hypothetical protein FE845_07050 [Marinobacter sp. 1-4A]|uniref:hypothetical protein n=1 Tax=Marinobacter sp. 1-4A TaxID=2582919 RepID=UPI001905069C|nr:hypothetical protein [Marinobacter sp. 1-4A]MBK1851092.1 hypothetical protein [Marinobacter sp. 1-4A]